MHCQLSAGLLLFTLLSLTFTTARSLNILIYNPIFAHSHASFMCRIGEVLAERGHQITVLEPVITDLPQAGCKERENLKIISVPSSRKTTETRSLQNNDEYWHHMWTSRLDDPFAVTSILKTGPTLAKMFGSSCENLLSERRFQRLLASKGKFDLAITELLDLCGLVIFNDLKISKTVGTSALSIYEGTSIAIGQALASGYVPGTNSVMGEDNSFFQRIRNIFLSYCSYSFQATLIAETEKIASEEFGEKISVWNMISSLSLIVTNSDPLLDFERPTFHKIIDVGGINVKEPKLLEKNWLELLDIRPKTVIVSFGTIAQSCKMPQAMLSNVFNVFKSFTNVTFVWKWESDLPEDVPENVVLTGWIPINDILANDKVVGFITHGGSGSTLEGANRGKPLIFIPIFGDQMRNSQMMVQHGCAIQLHKDDLFSNSLLSAAVNRLLNDERLIISAQSIRDLLKLRAFPPEEVLYRNIELLGFTETSLPRKAHRVPFMVYYNLDIFIAASLSFMLFLVVVIRLVMCILRIEEKKIKTQSENK